MKPIERAIAFSLLVGVWTLSCAASENSDQKETGISGPITDGMPALAPAPPEFTIKSTVVLEMEVVEPPPMSGLPPVEGTITATVNLVEDPKLPDPPTHPLALPPDVPAVVAQMEELQNADQDTRLVFVSATVYDHSRTFFHCSARGGVSSGVSGWSNFDFNHFSDFSTYQINGSDGVSRQYGLMMGVGNEDTRLISESPADNNGTEATPPIPTLPDLTTAGPSFVVTEGDTSDRETMELIEGMHDFYRVNGRQMEAAYQARISADNERRAYLLANPPVPRDVTVNFWERSHPVGMAANTIHQEGGN